MGKRIEVVLIFIFLALFSAFFVRASSLDDIKSYASLPVISKAAIGARIAVASIPTDAPPAAAAVPLIF